jgi:arylsulfatase A
MKPPGFGSRASGSRSRAIALGALLALGLLSPRAIADTPAKPNVIFILADDLGYGDLGCFGQKLIKTPNIDRLAAEGMKFTQAYAGATVCAPSRCSLMTGKHNGHASIRGNQEVQPEGQLPMPGDTFTVAHLMKRAGYATGLVGKWGLGHPGSASTPGKMGFDHFFGYNCQRLAHEYYPEYLWRDDVKVPLDGKTYSHDLMAADALEFIRANKDRPFFLDLSFTIPHAKLQVPDLAPYAKESWPENLKTLAAMITRMDGDVGRLMALLKDLGIDDRTMVIFASDNGAAYQDKLFDHSGPLRGHKRDMYEGGIRTPALARWPGKIKPGVSSSQVWAFWDVLPTLAELVGQTAPAGLDGISILPALLEGRTIDHPPLYWEFHEGGFDQAARIGDWKSVKNGARGPIELYDLKADPREQRDVASQHPDVVARFRDFLGTARIDSANWPIREESATKKAQRKEAK